MKLTGTNLTWMIAGAVVGGISGYLVTDLILYKLEERKVMKEFEEFNDGIEERLVTLANIQKSEIDKARIDYTKHSKSDLKDLVKQYTSEDAPYIVTVEDYNDEGDPFGRLSIIFYEEDAVFADANEEVIDNPQNLFGPNIHLHFGEKSEDPDIVYVCNPGEGVIFEIIRMHTSYKVEVLGEPAEPEKPKKAAPKRRARAAAKKKAEPEDDGSNQDSDSES